MSDKEEALIKILSDLHGKSVDDLADKIIALFQEPERWKPEDVIAWCREHLAHFKAPRAVVFGPLPKTSTGKIQKYVLREQAKAVD